MAAPRRARRRPPPAPCAPVSFIVLRCQACGSPLGAQPGNLLTVCGACGAAYPARELEAVPVHIVPSAPEAAVREAVRARMAGDRQMKKVAIEITEASGVYVPLYVSGVTVRGRWRGYQLRKRKKGSVKIWKDGALDFAGDFPVLARQHAHAFGLSALGRVLPDLSPVPMEEVCWADAPLPVLSVERTQAQADASIRDDLLDRLGDGIRRRNRLKAITEFEADVAIEDRLLLLLPLWTVTYRYRGGSLKVAVSGAGPTVLAAMEPVFLGQRLLRLALGVAAVAGAGAAFYVGAVVLGQMQNNLLGFLVLMGGAIGACSLAAWKTATKLVQSVQVEGGP